MCALTKAVVLLRRLDDGFRSSRVLINASRGNRKSWKISLTCVIKLDFVFERYLESLTNLPIPWAQWDITVGNRTFENDKN
ncbi:hypothetical protein CEXT_751571 [Caerostris extrusa]|uniref:Uncharacterized protein n=1 Tax=Caerostris extrusa TaxID=172846 RepID=A0AAV4NQK7_CAEEX|nr:hypothetical protein CEXT_751571 [Caerostris extrusa]